jgi:predicted permease
MTATEKDGMMRGAAGDIQLAIRSLGAAPAVTLPALLTLALGIGATTAIFSVANGLILRPLPVAASDRLVTVTSEMALRYGFQAGVGWSYAMWDRFRPPSGTFDGAFAWTLQRVDLSGGGEVQPATALVASGDFFNALGVHAARGRTFTAADDVRGGGPDGAVAVISQRLWKARFNAADEAIGSRLAVDGTPVTVIGVMGEGFRGVDVGQPFDLAIPFGVEALVHGRGALLDSPRSLLLTVMLRLKAGQTASQATAALRSMQPRILGPDAPPFLKEPFVVVGSSTGISDRSQLRQRYERPLVTLAIVSALVLMIVSVNIANLLLARSSVRRHEWSLRLALGAPRWRLARQPIVEGLALGVAGAVAGVIFAAWASRALLAQLPAPDGAVAIDLSIDWRVLAFAVGVTIAAVVLFTLAPAIHATRVPPLAVLQEEGRAISGRRTGILSSGLIVVQVALSIVLLAGAGLFIRTLSRLVHVPLGFDPDRMLVVAVDTTRSSRDTADGAQLWQRVQDAVRGVPGVRDVAASIWTPVGTGGGGVLTDARGRRADVGRQVAFNFITPGWFATYATPIHAGRDFDARDRAETTRVALINETYRRNLLKDGSAIGDTIDAGPCGREGCTVVGVVADTVYGRSLRDAPPPTVYVPLAQSTDLRPEAPLRLSVRVAGDPGRLKPDLASTLQRLDPRLTFTFRTIASDISAAVAQERLVAQLAGFFGAVGLLLSALGLYGVIAYGVTLRRGEIGIRLALGGRPRNVLKTVLARVGVSVLAGIVLGTVIALWLARFVAPLLYGIESRDPVTLVLAILILGSVAAVAAWIPASRAVRIDPARVLREY